MYCDGKSQEALSSLQGTSTFRGGVGEGGERGSLKTQILVLAVLFPSNLYILGGVGGDNRRKK